MAKCWSHFIHHATVNGGQRLSLREICIAKLATSIDQSGVVHIPTLSTADLPSHLATHLQPSSQQASFFEEQCTTALHFSLPANTHRLRHHRRLDCESINSPAPTAVMEFLFSSAAATRSGVAFAFYTSSSPIPLLTRSLNKPPTTCLITQYPSHPPQFQPQFHTDHVEQTHPNPAHNQCSEARRQRV